MALAFTKNHAFLLIGPLWVSLCLVLSCKNKGNPRVSEQLQAAPPTLEENIIWPKPDSKIGGIPVYDQFAHLEPLFRFSNDTTYVVNFWATWCKPCIQELPYFEQLHAGAKNDKLKVVLVSLDFPKKLESTLVPFVQKRGLQSPVLVLLDGKYNDWIDKVSPDWSGAIPATYIYKGAKSHLVGKPFENYEELKETVQPFL